MYVPLILTQFLDRAVRLYGEKTAVIDEEKRLTYKQLNERVNQLSHGLNDLGVTKGDRIAYLAPNTLEMLEGFYGVFQLGAIMVPLNIRLKPEDYLYILNHSESKLLFVDEELYHLIAPIKDKLETIERIIVQNGQGGDEDFTYDEWLKSYSTIPVDRAEMDENDVCSLLYTSGTTGKPKGVMLTHRNNYLHAMTTMHHLRVSDQDVYLHILPMFHVNGWGTPFYYTANGATHICLRKAQPEMIYQKILQHNVTVMHMAPTVLNSLLQYYDQEKPDVPKDIRVVIAGSAPPPAFVKRVEQDLGWEFIQVYGMTESSPLSLVSTVRSHLEVTMEEKHRIKAKAGYPMIGCEVKVVKENGEEVAWNGNEIGEVLTRSNGVMKGYWKNIEETMKTIENGWLHTGDMATVDEYGHIDIVDRKKDIIISGGENISSIEVEGVLYEHPAVQEAAVIAIPHEKWGETPHAFVVLKANQHVTEEDIIQFSRRHLAHFKAPTSVSFVDELPKTASGKIQKVHLRKQFWEGKERLVN